MLTNLNGLTASMTCRVINLHPVQNSRLIALASVELELEGVTFALHGIQVVRARKQGREATGVELPCYRAHDGQWHPAISLPKELHAPIADIVLQECLDAGLVKRAAMRMMV